jgi:hypothetical protein
LSVWNIYLRYREQRGGAVAELVERALGGAFPSPVDYVELCLAWAHSERRLYTVEEEKSHSSPSKRKTSSSPRLGPTASTIDLDSPARRTRSRSPQPAATSRTDSLLLPSTSSMERVRMAFRTAVKWLAQLPTDSKMSTYAYNTEDIRHRVHNEWALVEAIVFKDLEAAR